MFPRVTAILPLRPVSRFPLCSGGSEAPAAAIVLSGAPHGTVRAKYNIQRYFGTNNVIYSKKDEQSAPTHEISKETESQESVKENTKKDLLDIIKGMKVELNTVNVQTTKPSSRRQLKSVEATIGRLQKAREDAPKRTTSLNPELVAAASAVADFLPFDKQTTKSELLRQLQQHEEVSKAQNDGKRAKISVSNIISDMKVAKSATLRISTRPEHQIQFDEGTDDYMGQETRDLKKSLRKNMLKGKRLNIFDFKAVTEEAPETETAPSLWEVEFAKQLAAVNEQPLQNGFAEMIQWTKEGKLWEFPVNNEAGFDDDGSEFHEHVFLDKHLKDFPKQGPIRHFMELVTCGLSKNPYLSVKQKIEHIEWFRNYFNEKQDILKESGIQFN
ncbi:28S ribosomal protein S31, mitochondrial isoform X1 [Ursus maritimus]|uniref:Small ribosomal subunit protein mS31 n=1 Tax=Ursus maritimus TaxID=29073 RepID=A0A384DE70_URSMA|nr:28S ribosomal protein S31, mitochondrial isoform X1 [Ursus maritimus]